MAVVQQNKSKMRPVLDFRELNGYVDAYTAHADVLCAEVKESGERNAPTYQYSTSEGHICKCVCTNPCGHTKLLSLKEKGSAFRTWASDSLWHHQSRGLLLRLHSQKTMQSGRQPRRTSTMSSSTKT